MISILNIYLKIHHIYFTNPDDNPLEHAKPIKTPIIM